MMSGSLLLTAPELILSVGALLLLLVAGWQGDRAARGIGCVAVLLFVAAAASLLGPAGHGGSAFDGLYRADGFAAFAKLLIYGAAAVSVLVADRFFGRAGEPS